MKIRAVTRKERVKKMSLLVTLLTYGNVDIDKATSAGETALHIATKVVKRGDICILMFMLNILLSMIMHFTAYKACS